MESTTPRVVIALFVAASATACSHSSRHLVCLLHGRLFFSSVRRNAPFSEMKHIKKVFPASVRPHNGRIEPRWRGNEFSFVAASSVTKENACSKEKRHSQNGKKQHDNNKKLRVDRILGNRGMGSRSELKKLIKQGRVSLIEEFDCEDDSSKRNAVPIKDPSHTVPKDSAFIVDGTVVLPIPLLLAYHKPKGLLSAMHDNYMGRRHLGQCLDQRYLRAGVHPVGRLDYDSSGLILFSSDGALTQRLLHPRYAIEKEYVATVAGAVDADKLQEKLKRGVETAEGTHMATLLGVNERHLEQSDENGCTKSSVVTDLRLVVTEGKHRMVRRMLANCNYPVVDLRRDRHGIVKLRDLEVGAFRMLDDDELHWMTSLL